MSGNTNGHVLADTKDSGHAPSLIEQLSKALSDPTRLRIISVLLTGSKSLDTITKELGFDKKKKPNVKKHLEELKKPHLVFQIKEYGDYVLLAPKLTAELIVSLNSSSHELEAVFLSILGAADAYVGKKYARTEDEKKEMNFAFDLSMDNIFKTDIFSKIGGRLRLICIKMAHDEEYDFSRLRDSA